MNTPIGKEHRTSVAAAQDRSHPVGHDYAKGSPHLRHESLRSMVVGRLCHLVEDSLSRTGSCRVLEVGAGHGTFTQTLLGAGATVTVTEASSASAAHLRNQFADERRVDVREDPTGEAILEAKGTWDLVVLISVLHHIPDYLSFLERLQRLVAPGGAIFSVQDPLYYPRRSRPAHALSRASYLAWRLFQGDYERGLATRLRRLRGVYDDTEESDLVEFHVVRNGCDEHAIEQLLSRSFDVEVFTYWSTQSPVLQRLFEHTGLRSDFGLQAQRRLA